MLVKTNNVKKTVVHDAVDVVVNGILAHKGNIRPLFNIGVKEKIIVYVVALISVTAPDPSVTLDSVKKALTAVEMEGIGAGVPNFVEQLVVTTKTTAPFKWKILIIGYNVQFCGCAFDKYVSERFAFQGVSTFSTDALEGVGVIGVKRLLAALAVIYAKLGFGIGFQNEESCKGLPSEIVEHSAVNGFLRYRTYLFMVKGKDFGIFFRRVVIFACSSFFVDMSTTLTRYVLALLELDILPLRVNSI